MSHVATCSLVFKDLAALKAEVAALGGMFIEGKQTWKWYGRFMNDWNDARAAVNNNIDPKTYGQCLHVIRPPGWKEGDYEIGVQAHPEGGFRLVYDNWGPSGKRLEQWAGVDMVKLKTQYGANVAETALKLKGYVVERTTEKGKLKLVARNYGS